jgi:hypothetical protein
VPSGLGWLRTAKRRPRRPGLLGAGAACGANPGRAHYFLTRSVICLFSGFRLRFYCEDGMKFDCGGGAHAQVEVAAQFGVSQAVKLLETGQGEQIRDIGAKCSVREPFSR